MPVSKARPEADVQKAMRGVKSKSTTPELVLRRALFRLGLRYRIHRRDLPGKPDIVFGPARVVVFVDGDFWHGNQWRLRGKISLAHQLEGVSNERYWNDKISKNIARDKKNDQLLHEMGWVVVRLWESTLTNELDQCLERIVDLVTQRRSE